MASKMAPYGSAPGSTAPGEWLPGPSNPDAFGGLVLEFQAG